MDRPPHYEDVAWQRDYHRNQAEDIAKWSSMVHYLTKTNSQNLVSGLSPVSTFSS